MHAPTASARGIPAVEMLEARTLFAVTPNDPLFPQEWWVQRVSAPQAWEFTTGSSRVIVNVNDSGIDYTHPDLYLNIWLNQAEIPFRVGGKGLRDADSDGLITFRDLNARGGGRLVNGAFVADVNANGYIDGGDLLNDPRWENGVDDGGNGFVDDLVGWDFEHDDNNPMEDGFHGTACAGVIGTVGNNGEGGAGVAWRVQLMATKALKGNGGSNDAFDLSAGIHYAVDNGARVTNNSWGGNLNDRDLKVTYEAVDYARAKGVLWVASAGNNGWDNDLDSPRQNFPASFDLPNIVSVAASTEDDQLASFASYGLTSVDLAAPGDLVGSTLPIAENPEFPYGVFVGSSFAAPHVAGAAALLLARDPGLSYAEVKDLILRNVDPLPAFAGKTVSGGRLNIHWALAAVPVAATASVVSGTSTVFSTTRVSSDCDFLATSNAVLG